MRGDDADNVRGPLARVFYPYRHPSPAGGLQPTLRTRLFMGVDLWPTGNGKDQGSRICVML